MHRAIATRSFDDIAVEAALARSLLRAMIRARAFDERAVALQRRGWMSSYPPARGQEASQVGTAGALAAEDWLFPTYRTTPLQLARGRPPADILRYRRGRSEFEAGRTTDDTRPSPGRGTEGRDGDAEPSPEERIPSSARTFTQSTPIATHLPHAVGWAMAGQRSTDDTEGVVCAYFGDGATSEGDFHEALNFAGVFDAPVLFLCENNHWAISMAADGQTRSETLATKASAYGIEGVRVDGMDPLAVAEVVSEARESVTDGEPVLVESLAYRQGAHSTSDDPDRYRDDDDVDLPDWRTADPIERYASYLREASVIDGTFVDEAHETAEAWLDEAVATVESAPTPEPETLFGHAFARLPPRVTAQRDELSRRVAAGWRPGSVGDDE